MSDLGNSGADLPHFSRRKRHGRTRPNRLQFAAFYLQAGGQPFTFPRATDMRNLQFITALTLVFTCAGCGIFQNPITCNPGSESYQINQAKAYDPYPDPNSGPPVVGGRPLDYINPRPEPDVTKPMFVNNPRYGAPPAAYGPPQAYYQAPNGSYVMAGPPVVTPGAPAAITSAPAFVSAPAVSPALPTNPIYAPPGTPTSASALPVAYGTSIPSP